LSFWPQWDVGQQGRMFCRAYNKIFQLDSNDYFWSYLEHGSVMLEAQVEQGEN